MDRYQTMANRSLELLGCLKALLVRAGSNDTAAARGTGCAAAAAATAPQIKETKQRVDEDFQLIKETRGRANIITLRFTALGPACQFFILQASFKIHCRK